MPVHRLRFDWSNFEAFAPVLLGDDAAPSWIIDTEFGRSSNFVVNNPNCTGRVEFLELVRGLRVVVFDCHWREEKRYAVRDGDWVRFNFSLAIDIAMQLSLAQSIKVSSPSWRIINNPPDSETIEAIPADTKATWVTVCCKPEFVQELTGADLENLPDFLQDSLPAQGDQGFYEYYDFTSRLNSITADVLRTKIDGPLRVPFIEARCIELLCLAIHHLTQPLDEYQPVRLTTSDRGVIEKARDLLVKDYAQAPSVSQLSKSLGVNKNKLFYGFKMLFGLTISEFIQEQRLNEGKRLLQQSELPISEIANQVGFKHQSNFATAMKKHFGMTPRQFRE